VMDALLLVLVVGVLVLALGAAGHYFGELG
jgi:hypothetical protein